MVNIDLLQGDCLELMRDIPDGSVDLIVTDPPYKVTPRGGRSTAVHINNIYNMDCLDGMRMIREQGIKVDWIITDPPYGIGEDGKKNHSRSCLAQATQFTPKEWDKKRIERPYFDLMREMSREQIIFGGNYYTDFLPPSSCWIVWDKENGETDFADCELAWCSHKSAVRICRYRWQGMLQGNMKNKEVRVHPCQKPLPVIEWILNKYTKEGDIICDPFSGSGTVAVACHRLNRKYICFELDKEYYDISMIRLNDEKAQQTIFDLGVL